MESEERAPAPGELGLVEAFVNTLSIENRTDELDSPSSLRSWLVEHGLIAPGDAIEEEDVNTAREVREALRALLIANNDGPRDESAAAVLEATSDRAKMHLRFDEESVARLEPGAPGTRAALGRLIAIVFEAMREGSWGRLKACRNEGCRWAFYDGSKNRRGTWCSMATCGNRAKTLAYYRRHRKG
jgi:predicted RNA-binding Zn ribbon-like protein